MSYLSVLQGANIIGGPSLRSRRGLAVLSNLPQTVWHLIGDNYTSGNWTSSVGSDIATVVSSPTKVASTTFKGRSSISVAGGSGFHIADGSVTGSTAVTYEIILDDYGSVNSQFILGKTDASIVQISNILYKSAATTRESALYNNAAAIYLGSAGFVVTNVDNKPVFYTIVIDVAAPSYKVYQNGVLVFTDTTTSGTLGTPGALRLGIGFRWNQSVASSPFTGKFLEIAKHNIALDDATVASRCAQFNSLKGYT